EGICQNRDRMIVQVDVGDREAPAVGHGGDARPNAGLAVAYGGLRAGARDRAAPLAANSRPPACQRTPRQIERSTLLHAYHAPAPTTPRCPAPTVLPHVVIATGCAAAPGATANTTPNARPRVRMDSPPRGELHHATLASVKANRWLEPRNGSAPRPSQATGAG